MVEQIREGEEEVEEISNKLRVYKLGGNCLQASFHLFLVSCMYVSPKTHVFGDNLGWLQSFFLLLSSVLGQILTAD